METWVGTDGQGLYRVGLHYNRIDRRRRHTLSHNLGLKSPPKCISHFWIRTSFCPDDVSQLNWTQSWSYWAHRIWHTRNTGTCWWASSRTYLPRRRGPPCAMLHDKCAICIWFPFVRFIYIAHFKWWTLKFLKVYDQRFTWDVIRIFPGIITSTDLLQWIPYGSTGLKLHT
jgi:hypothetical protein